MDLRHQPGGHPKGDEVESSGEFIAFTLRMEAGFSRPANREHAIAPSHPASRPVQAKSRGRP
jgi:hypothetical protein